MRVPGLDPGINPRICRWHEIAVSSTAMTALILNPLTPSRFYLINTLNKKSRRQMEATDRLSKVYGALAHPVRRAILAQLARGEAKVGDISARFDMSGPAITNHLKVLEKAGLVRRRTAAQARILSFEPSSLREGEQWMSAMRQFWQQSFDRLEAHLAGGRKARQRKGRGKGHDQDDA
jgi:DNA-binding transcriptional ArsR family regulator